MNKTDLKVGYVAECRKGELKMIMPSKNVIVAVNKCGSYTTFNSLNDDLTTTFDTDYDFIKVYGYSNNENEVLKISTDDRPLLWERKPPIEVTMKEVCEKFGCDVVIKKEDK